MMLFSTTDLIFAGYQIQYKTPGMQRYISNNVAITHEGDHDVATISNLLPRQSYNFKITAIQGWKRNCQRLPDSISSTSHLKKLLAWFC